MASDDREQQLESDDAGRAVTPQRHPSEVVIELVQAELAATSDPTALARITELDAKLDQALRSSKSEATIRAYRADWDDFTIWCASLGLSPLPAAPATVAAYLADLADPPSDQEPRAISTILRRKAAIGEAHKLAGYHDNPCLDPLVRTATKGIKRNAAEDKDQMRDRARRVKKGVTTADVRAIVGALDGSATIDVRDKAVLLLGFATALRRSELVELDVEDLEDHTEGLLVHIGRSKTDQEGIGHRIEVAYGEHLDTCPVRAYRTWLDVAGINTGPVFRPVSRGGSVGDSRLSDRTIARIVKKRIEHLGYDSTRFSGHSLRRGFATQAARAQAPDRTIVRTTRHTSSRGLDPYIADAEIFRDPPSKYLGL